ncbi:MAG: 16S rRNA (cytosine(1402)-N(4))-methyltransferase, partial [Rhodoplanes sp.]
MTGRDTRTGVAGGLARHIPVLARQAVEFLAIRKHGVYVDATFGGGGYTRAILAADDDAQVLGLDRDRTAIALGADLVDAAGGRLTLVQSPFSALDD